MTTLLLIEDDPYSARLVHKALASHQYEIHHAPTGLEGLRLARQVSPQVVLVDLNLPDLEGKAIVSQLRGRILEVGTTIIAFTAEDDARTRRIMRAFGCDDLIGKPIDTRTFADQIAQVIQRKAGQAHHG
jgi:DNA-binding response OmpR family regulator